MKTYGRSNANTVVRVLAVFAIALLSLISSTAPARAHASLSETTPTAQADLAESPKIIRLSFNEGVQPISGSIRLIREDGVAVDLGRAKRITNGIETAPPNLTPGAYVVAWRVVSDDGHPVRGAFTFRVGNIGDQQKAASLATSVLASGSKNGATGLVFNLVRFLRLIITFVAVGLLLSWFLRTDTAPPARALNKVAIAGIVIEALLLLVYGPFVSGRTLSGLTDGTLLDDTLHDPISKASFARLIAFVALAVLVRRPSPSSTRRWTIAGAIALALAAQLWPGHATVGRWSTIAGLLSFVHVAAAAIWIGGLLWLGFVALRRPSANDFSLARRYSRVATCALAAVVLTGVFANFRQVGSLRALRTTDFGKVLLIKLALVVVVALLGLQNRRSLAGGSSWQPERFRRAVSREALLGICVLIATTVLTGLPPARDAVTKPYATSIEKAELIVDITAEPARRGRNELHFYTLTPTGSQLKVESISATASLPSKQIEDLPLRLTRAGSNHFQVLDADLPVPGTWTLDVSVNIDEFTEIDGSTTIEID